MDFENKEQTTIFIVSSRLLKLV